MEADRQGLPERPGPGRCLQPDRRLGKRNAKIFKMMGMDVDATGEAFKTTAETDAFKMHQALAQLESSAITLGAELLPVVAAMVKTFGDLAKIFVQVPFAKELLIFAVAIGPMVRLTGSVITLVGWIIKLRAAYVGVTAASTAATVAQAPFGAAMGGSAVATRGMSLAFLGPAGLAVGAAAVVAGLTILALKLTDNRSTMEKVRQTARALGFEFGKQAQAVRDARTAKQEVAHWDKVIAQLEAKGAEGTKAWRKAYGSLADSLMEFHDAQRKSAEAEAEITEKLPELKQEVADLRAEIGKMTHAWQTDAAADKAEDLALAIAKVKVAVIDAQRAEKGLDPLGPFEDAEGIVGAFRKRFGKELTLKIGMIKDPAMVRDLAQMSNQLLALGKPKKVHAILSNESLTAAQKMAKMQALLIRLTGGKWDITMGTEDLKVAQARLRGIAAQKGVFDIFAKGVSGSLKGISQLAAREMKEIKEVIRSGKDPTAALAHSYQQMADGIARAMKEGKISTKQGLAAIQQLLEAELSLYGFSIATAKDVGGTWGAGTHGPKQNKAAKQAGGIMEVLGSGSGDKVPLWAEPGEVVVNRKAVAAMGGPER